MITLKADIPQEVPFVPVSPVTMPSAWTYSIPDSMAETIPSSDIAEFEFTARPGQMGSLDVEVSVPVTRPGVVILPYIESNIQRWDLAEVTATSAGVPISVTFPEFGVGTTEARLGFELREPAAGAILSTNLYTDPRCTTTSMIAPKYPSAWTVSTVTAGSDLPMQAGLRTYAASITDDSVTASGRGLDLWQSVLTGSPDAGIGFDVSGMIGDTLTVSGWFYSTKAGTFQMSARCFSGTTWTAAASTGTATAITASTWTRYSATITVPTGAALMGVTFVSTTSVAWVSGDQIRVSAILLEESASLNTYYDGSTADTGSEGFYWNGTAHASTTAKFDRTGGATQPGRSLIVGGLTMAVEANAEEVVGAALTRPLRRSVYDALNDAAPQIAVGTPGLLAGSITYLCATLEDALALDGVYQFAGLITLETGGALDGFKHMAVDQLRLTAERTVNGRPAKWLVQAEVRELVA